MIIVKISSGLGNQLFQYAYAKSLESRGGQEVKIDTSSFGNWPSNITPRFYLLDKFNISLEVATPEDFKCVGAPYPGDRSIKENMYRVISKIIEYFRNQDNKKIIVDHRLSFNPKMLDIIGDKYVSGSFASYKYFDHLENILRKEFTLKGPFSNSATKLISKIDSSTSVSVHIRRSDYLNYKRKFVILDENYYQKAVYKIKEQIKDPEFFIFSDDIGFVKENYNKIFGANATYISGADISDVEELILMSRCKHNIIANSTFSWWGAWLNENPQKLIVAPERYRTDNRDMENFLPPQWIII